MNSQKIVFTPALKGELFFRSFILKSSKAFFPPFRAGKRKKEVKASVEEKKGYNQKIVFTPALKGELFFRSFILKSSKAFFPPIQSCVEGRAGKRKKEIEGLAWEKKKR